MNPNITLQKAVQLDAPALLTLRTNPQVNQFINRDTNINLTDIEKFIEKLNADPNNTYYYTIKLHEQLVGSICLWNIDYENKYAELGYELLPEFQNQGIMSQAVTQIIQLAFHKLRFNCIEAYTHYQNINSIKLLHKFNFKHIQGKTDQDNPNNIIFRLENKNILG